MSRQSSDVKGWVRVAGTGRRQGLPNAVLWTSEALGRAIAHEGYGLVTGGWPGVDYVVSDAFNSELRKQRCPLSSYLIQVVASSKQPDFRGGHVVYVEPGPQEWIEGLKHADVVVLIGGEGGVYETYSYAAQEQRPTFPIAATEGDAQRVFEKMLSQWALFPLEGISKDDFRECLGMPIKDRLDADLVIEGLMKLLRAHFVSLSSADSTKASSTFPGSTIAILFLAADPTDASRLRLGEEFREIQDKLKLAKLRDRFKLELPQLSVRPSDLSQALLDTQPQIVHFSGHGTSAGVLCLEDQVGGTQPVEPDALAALFELVAAQVQCVVLNACYSGVQANAIGTHIPYVIGMSQAIGDKAAIAFAVGFYQALGAGRSIEDAYKLGCVQIRLQGIPEHLTPVLIKKGQM